MIHIESQWIVALLVSTALAAAPLKLGQETPVGDPAFVNAAPHDAARLRQLVRRRRRGLERQRPEPQFGGTPRIFVRALERLVPAQRRRAAR